MMGKEENTVLELEGEAEYEPMDDEENIVLQDEGEYEDVNDTGKTSKEDTEIQGKKCCCCGIERKTCFSIWSHIAIFIIGCAISFGITYKIMDDLVEFYRAVGYQPSDEKDRRSRSFYGNVKLTTASGSNLRKPQFQYYTCEEFSGEMNEYKRDKERYTIGELYFCAQMNTWNWLNNECIDLNYCPHPRNMPGWNYMDGTMKLHASLRRLFVLLLHFSKKHPSNFQWHVIGGSLLGILRQGDIIPHDHDGDIVIKNNVHRQFLMNNIREFPDDIGIFQDSWRFKITDVNGCMEKFEENNYGPFIDLIIVGNTNFALEQFTTTGFTWNWDTDVEPIQKIDYHNYKWPVPKNWPKAIAGDFWKHTRIVYTYVPFILDKGAANFQDYMCKSDYNPVTDDNFKKHSTWKNKKGMLHRIDRPQ